VRYVLKGNIEAGCPAAEFDFLHRLMHGHALGLTYAGLMVAAIRRVIPMLVT
jgi:hypothetical protein